MSVESITLALNHSRSVGAAKVILIGIANHDGDGGSWPSVGTLARYANVTERTVQRHINTLIELGEVERVMNDGGTHRTPSHMRPNLYKILLRCPKTCDGTTNHRNVSADIDPLTPVSPPDASVTPPPDASVTPPVTPVSPEPSFNHPLNRPEKKEFQPPSPVGESDEDAIKRLMQKPAYSGPSWLPHDYAQLHEKSLLAVGVTLTDAVTHYLEGPLLRGKPHWQDFAQWVTLEVLYTQQGKALPKRSADLTEPTTPEEAFNMFWDAYPKQERRPIAIPAFKAALNKAQPLDIITGARLYSRQVGELPPSEMQYVPQPHTWLNDERWKERAKQKSRSHTAAD